MALSEGLTISVSTKRYLKNFVLQDIQYKRRNVYIHAYIYIKKLGTDIQIICI